MCANFSRRHHLAGRGDAGQDAAAATALLGDKYAQVTGLSLIHISEPTRPLYISYAVFCLKKKKKKKKGKKKGKKKNEVL